LHIVLWPCCERSTLAMRALWILFELCRSTWKLPIVPSTHRKQIDFIWHIVPLSPPTWIIFLIQVFFLFSHPAKLITIIQASLCAWNSSREALTQQWLSSNTFLPWIHHVRIIIIIESLNYSPWNVHRSYSTEQTVFNGFETLWMGAKCWAPLLLSYQRQNSRHLNNMTAISDLFELTYMMNESVYIHIFKTRDRSELELLTHYLCRQLKKCAFFAQKLRKSSSDKRTRLYSLAVDLFITKMCIKNQSCFSSHYLIEWYAIINYFCL